MGSGKPRLTIVGKVLERGSGDPIFGVTLRHLGSRAAPTTRSDGSFEFSIPYPRKREKTKLALLMPGYWARVVRLDRSGIANNRLVVNEELTSLTALSEGTKKWFGFLPTVLNFWFGATVRARIFLILFVGMCFLPAAVWTVYKGWPVPREQTAWVREKLQRVPLLHHGQLGGGAPVRYSKLRRHYLAGVTYEIPAGNYTATQEIVIDRDAEVIIRPGVQMFFLRDVGIHCEGKLIAAGSSSAPIYFNAATSDQGWANITLWGSGTRDSKFECCFFQDASGRRLQNSIDGEPYLSNSGSPKGGALVLYNTSIIVSGCKFTKCRATAGGAVFIKNAPPDSKAAEPLRGSTFVDTAFSDCVSESQTLAPGGAVFVQDSYPEFRKCTFEGNQARGRESCGGAVYVGRRAQVRITECTFRNNYADAEGGALYGIYTKNQGGENIAGIVVENKSKFISNRARGSGGAISCSNALLKLSECEFDDNSVEGYEFDGTVEEAKGGAVHVDTYGKFAADAPLKIEDCKFRKNKALIITADGEVDERSRGGALDFSLDADLAIEIKEAEFIDNYAAFGHEIAVTDISKRHGWKDLDNSSTRKTATGFDYPQVAVCKTHRKPYSGLVKAPQIDKTFLFADGQGFNDRPSGASINAVVIHFISAITVDAAKKYDVPAVIGILHGEVPGTKPTSAHYLIDHDGNIHGLVPENLRAWHAGESRMPSGEENVNDFSIGIEMIRTKEDPPTDAQYRALVSLLCDIRRRHPDVTFERIVGHDTVRALWNLYHPEKTADWKEDPGPLFCWPYLFTELQKAEFE